MNKRISHVFHRNNASVIIVVLFVIVGCTAQNVFRQYDNYDLSARSPSALVIDSNTSTIFIAESSTKRISLFNMTGESLERCFLLPSEPNGIVLSPDGSRLYVTCGSAKGQILEIEVETGRIVKRIPAGHTPGAPVISPDGGMLYVCSRFDNNLIIVDLNSEKYPVIVPMIREPIAAAITPDGKYLFVANHLPSAHQIDAYITDGGYMDIRGYSQDTAYASKSVVVVVNTDTFLLEAVIQLPEGSNALKDVCVSPDGSYAYVTHILARYKEPTVSVQGGAINANALSIINVAEMNLDGTVLLDDNDKGYANPWGICCSENGKHLFVAHSGTHEISMIDRARLHRKLKKYDLHHQISTKLWPHRLEYDTGFMAGIRRRIPLSGNGPRFIAYAGNRLYVTEYFSDSIAIVEFSDDGRLEVRSCLLGGGGTFSEARRGEMLFHDATLCFQSWQSCASCHPGGRMDALNWDLLNDGEGNPKNTKSLLLSHDTPPEMITGIRATGEDAVRAGLRHILFRDHEESIAVVIDSYLRSQQPVESPHLGNGKLTRSARRGEGLFRKCGCMECHPPPLYTDLNEYDVGSGRGDERKVAFDTPTLIELWRTGPYLYDGRAQSAYEVLTTYNRNDKHGITSSLNYQDLNDLVEFLYSL